MTKWVITSAVAPLVFACGSSAPAPAAQDAGARDAVADTSSGGAFDASQPFPVTDGAAPSDAGSACDQQRAQVTALQATAQACDPRAASPCNGAVDGVCCPVTVSFDTGQAIDDFTQAVNAYKAQCTPDCSRVRCGQAPSNVCAGSVSGAKGTCE